MSAAALPAVGAWAAAPRPMRAIFINPGRSNEDFWLNVSAVMRAAAADLDIRLEIVYGERSVLYTQQIALERIRAAAPEDYLLVDNEHHSAGPILEAALARGLKCLMVFNGFFGGEVARYGPPRQKFPNFLGEVLSDNVAAGAEIARGLIAAAKQAGAPLQMIGINGDPETPAAADRLAGLRQATTGIGDLSLKQVLSTDWTRAEGLNRAAGLLDRYPETSIVWCANDPLALGALDAALARGRRPGRDIFIGGVNWSKAALTEISAGRLVLSLGGHLLLGGWALVMLRDYHEGLDFAALPGGASVSVPFGALHRGNIGGWLDRYGTSDWTAVRFARFSRFLNGRRDGYDFSLPAIIS